MDFRKSPAFAFVIIAALLAGCAESADTGARTDGTAAMVESPGPEVSAAGETAIPEAVPGGPSVKRQIFKGSGRFINREAASQPPVRVTQTGDVILNFAGANIGEVVRSVLGNTLKLNYVLHPKVQGTVTVQTSRPLPRSALLATLEHILRFNGAALVEAEGVYKVLPLEEATSGAIRPRLRSSQRFARPGFGVEIVPLKYVAATEMEKILKPFAPPRGIVRVDTARNLLMLAGTRLELENLVDIVEIFDVDWLSGMSVAVLPLQFTEAKVLIDDLENVFGSKADGPLAGVVRFVPIERLNAILVLTAQPAYLDTATAWVERLDQGADTGERRLHVYRVQNGRATELADVLSKIFATDAERQPPRPSLAPGRTPTEIRSRTTGSTGPQQTPERRISAAQTRRTQAPTAAAPSPQSQVAQRRAAAGLPGASAVAAGQPAGLLGGEGIRIFADETKNAIIVLATRRDYRMIASAIRQLDIAPLQVLIEATIAEVRLNEELRYGLQWFFQRGNSSFTLSATDVGSVASVFPGFSYVLAGGGARVVLDLLSGLTDVNVISSPQLMVLDNQTATLQVGDEVPVSTQQTSTVIDPDAPLVSTIQFRDTGVILRVTPRVNAGGLVMMDVEQEVSNVVTTTAAGTLTPTIRQRRIQSTVAVQSGETVALGGLIQDSKNKSKSGIPLLSDIPILGILFGTTTDEVDRTELLVMLTPRIIRDQNEARTVTEELRRRIRSVEPLMRRVR